MNGVYIILYACQIMCAAPRQPTITLTSQPAIYTKTAAEQIRDYTQAVAEQPDSRTCEPDVLLTGDREIAEKALASNTATVFHIDRKLKVYKLSRAVVYHIDEVEQAAPAAPR